ncbi:MAG: hypothetical protein FJ004_10225 [Chloroflexi bacterium]|nr:hypothetical protein [Chloroflexota bacterium]
MRKAVLVGLFVLGLVMGICLSGLAGASTQYQKQVIPLVNVESGGSLSIGGDVSGPDNNLVNFGSVAPGSTTTRTVIMGINANDVWRLTVSKTKNLECTNVGDPGYGQFIPSSSFTYTSNGLASATYVGTDTEFGSNGTPSNVVTGGSAVGGCNVNVVYKLAVPSSQPKGYYTAPHHTYTLIVGS